MSMFFLFCRVIWNDRDKSVFWHLRCHIASIAAVAWTADRLLSLIYGA